MHFIILGARNLWRTPRRTLTTGLTLLVGIVAIIVTRSVVEGLNRDVIALKVDTETAHISFFRPDYDGSLRYSPFKNLLVGGSEKCKKMSSSKDVLGVTPRLAIPARICDGLDLMPIRAVGVAPTTDRQVFGRLSIDEGAWFKDRNAKEMIVSRAVARSLRLSLKQWVTLVTLTKDGALSAQDLQITAIYSSGNPQVDGRDLLLPIDTLCSIVALPGDSAGKIYVRADGCREKYDKIRSLAYDCIGHPLHHLTWYQEGRGQLAVTQRRRSAVNVIVLFIAIVVAVSVTNSLLMSAYERKKEIATLRAMGFYRKEVLWLFLIEGTLLGLFTAVLGCSSGTLIVLVLEKYGVPLNIGQQVMEIPLPLLFKPLWSIDIIRDAFLFAMFVTFGSSFYPAWHASKVSTNGALE